MPCDYPYIDVAVPLPVFQPYTYQLSKLNHAGTMVGKRVLVPFGKRQLTGYVLSEHTDTPKTQLKDVIDILDDHPLFPKVMVPLFKWISEYYIQPLGEVIKTALPGGLTLYDHVHLSLTPTGERAMESDGLIPQHAAMLQLLSAKPTLQKSVEQKFNGPIPRSLLDEVVKNGWVSKERRLIRQTANVKRIRFARLVSPPQPTDKLSPQRQMIADYLYKHGETAINDLRTVHPTAAQLIRAMARDGLVEIVHRPVYRDPLGESITPDKAPQLNGEQAAAVEALTTSLGDGYQSYLLAGVTGSGKTEVYLDIAAKTVSKGLGVIVLVPEIALISQTERRFRARFGNKVAVLHSGLSGGERYDQWRRVARGDAAIAIGARSAVFAPFEKLGLIVVDEEHDTTYKQEGALRYNARDVAVVRAKLNRSLVILGSATPSVQSSYNVSAGKFNRLKLSQRVEERPMPHITVVNLTDYRDARGTRRYFSDELRQAMAATLARGDQVLLFLNRRGFANLPICMACGEAVRCKNCDISLTLHQGTHAFRCHYCGFSRAAAAGCPACGSTSIKPVGFGTEKIEEVVREMFPTARVARMDRDTTAKRGALLKLLKDLKNRKIDVLVGTQMVAKGHDFPNITLVGIICADLSLNFPDFRAGERTFQLLTQVSGRAGRGDAPGQVILQTYTPDHFSIQAAKAQDFEAFYDQEIIFRRSLQYPPFSRMIQIKISGKSKAATVRRAMEIGRKATLLKNADPAFSSAVRILGPIESPLVRIARHYRWQILLKGDSSAVLHRFLHQLLKDGDLHRIAGGVRVALDVDPFFMM
ncbi:MAG: primosomal protein N' [Desulfobacteraceae bacterium]|nr:primosomal protein N' [Desulfobacteraceae bacterium]